MIKKETSFIDLKQVKIDDPFFSRVQNVVIHTMLPYQERVLHDEVSGIRKSHVIKNFRIAAGDEKGTSALPQASRAANFTGWSFRTATWRNGWRRWRTH